MVRIQQSLSSTIHSNSGKKLKQFSGIRHLTHCAFLQKSSAVNCQKENAADREDSQQPKLTHACYCVSITKKLREAIVAGFEDVIRCSYQGGGSLSRIIRSSIGRHPQQKLILANASNTKLEFCQAIQTTTVRTNSIDDTGFSLRSELKF